MRACMLADTRRRQHTSGRQRSDRKPDTDRHTGSDHPPTRSPSDRQDPRPCHPITHTMRPVATMQPARKAGWANPSPPPSCEYG